MRYLNNRMQKRGEAEDGNSTLEVTVRSRETKDTSGKSSLGNKPMYAACYPDTPANEAVLIAESRHNYFDRLRFPCLKSLCLKSQQTNHGQFHGFLRGKPCQISKNQIQSNICTRETNIKI